MFFTITFLGSGAAIALLVASKRLEESRQEAFFISTAISKGDARLREISHRITHKYSEYKEKAAFLIQKQIPKHTKSFFNKSASFLREQTAKHASTLRDHKILRKSEGISEFFKSVSSVEKGKGEINELYEDSDTEK